MSVYLVGKRRVYIRDHGYVDLPAGICYSEEYGRFQARRGDSRRGYEILTRGAKLAPMQALRELIAWRNEKSPLYDERALPLDGRITCSTRYGQIFYYDPTTRQSVWVGRDTHDNRAQALSLRTAAVETWKDEHNYHNCEFAI